MLHLKLAHAPQQKSNAGDGLSRGLGGSLRFDDSVGGELGFWDQAKEDAANLAWVERLFADVQPFNTGEVYVNSLDEGEGHRVREAYGINYTRLVALKAKFDPTNFFRCNHNIPP
jgi:hypothetical protein